MPNFVYVVVQRQTQERNHWDGSGIESFETSKNILLTTDYVEAVAKVEELRTSSMTLHWAGSQADDKGLYEIVYLVGEPYLEESSNGLLIQKWNL